MDRKYLNNLADVITERNGYETVSLQDIEQRDAFKNTGLDTLARTGYETISKTLYENGYRDSPDSEDDIFTLDELVIAYQFLR